METISSAITRISEISIAQPLEMPGRCASRIGVIALATDFLIEDDLRALTPDGAAIYSNRVTNSNPITVANLSAMAADISRAACGLLPGYDIDVLIYACTSGTVVIGENEVIELMRARGHDISCTTPVTAANAAFAALSARKISILTPYLTSVNREIVDYFQRSVEVINIAGFGLGSDEDISAVTADSIEQAAIEICDPKADALFISCTGLRAAQVAQTIEDKLGKPVITSNQALAWHALELIGKPYQITGFGRLFTHRLSLS